MGGNLTIADLHSSDHVMESDMGWKVEQCHLKNRFYRSIVWIGQNSDNKDVKESIKTCVECGHQTKGHIYKCCGCHGTMKTWYCSKKCQKQNWRVHKSICPKNKSK